MNWFIIAFIAFFLLALAAVIDKFLLTKSEIVPISYAFYVSVLGGLASTLLLIFEPNFYFPKNYWFILVGGGISFYFALYFMYLAVQKAEISKVNPLIISLTPLIIFFFSFFLPIQSPTLQKTGGAFLIIISSYFLSQTGSLKTKLNFKNWLLIILSCLMFALANIFNKMAYNNLSFINAFVWLRWFSLITALIFTSLIGAWPIVLNLKKRKFKKIELVINYFKNIAHHFFAPLHLFRKKVSSREQWLVFALGQIVGGLGVLLMQYAIKLGNVVLVTALNGLEFFFVILIVYFLSKIYPRILREDISGYFLKEKIIWSIVLFIGVFLVII